MTQQNMKSKLTKKYIIKGKYFSSKKEIAQYYNAAIETVVLWTRNKITCEGDSVRIVRLLL